jgi:hypothetical protein
LLARRVVRSAKGPIRILCMPHPTLSEELSLIERPAFVRTHDGQCPVAWPSTNVAIRFVRRPMASKDSVDAQVLKAAAPCTTAPPRGIHRLACAHPYARTRSWSRPRLTWHELDKSKYAPIAKWVHAGG